MVPVLWGASTFRVTSVVWEGRPLLVPVMASVSVPVVVLLVVATERVDVHGVGDEEDETVVGDKEHVALLGHPLTVRPTSPLNPPLGDTETV